MSISPTKTENILNAVQYTETEVQIKRTAKDLIATYGHLLTQEQLASVLHRKVSGLRWSLCRTKNDVSMQYLHKVERSVGRRKYYPAMDVAKLIHGAAAILAT